MLTIQTSSLAFIWLISPQAPDTLLARTHRDTYTHAASEQQKLKGEREREKEGAQFIP